MVRLIAQSPLAGLDESAGGVRLREVDPGPITALAPLGRDAAALDAALLRVHGLGFPAPGETRAAGAARILWSGPHQALLLGACPDPGLSSVAAMTDQSDAWAALELSGAAAAQVLARLVSVDLREVAFPAGHTARCQLVHMNCSLTRPGPQVWLILVFRSMARSAADEVLHAIAGVAARG